MNVHDEEFLDEIALLALGVLPGPEAETVAMHVRSCESCRELYAQLRPAADLIGYSAEESAGDDEIGAARRKHRIMASVRDSTRASQDAVALRRRSYLPWMAAAAAVLIAGGLSVQNANLRNDYDREARIAQQASAQRIAQQAAAQRLAQQSSAERANLDRNVLALLGPTAKRYAVPHGVVISHDGRLFVALRDLARPPSGKVYQTWTLANGQTAMTPGGTFIPDGSGVALVELGVPADSVAAVAVSVEPTGGSRAPTSKPTFVRKLS